MLVMRNLKSANNQMLNFVKLLTGILITQGKINLIKLASNHTFLLEIIKNSVCINNTKTKSLSERSKEIP